MNDVLKPSDSKPQLKEYYCPNCGLKYEREEADNWMCVFCFNLFDRDVTHILKEVGSTISLNLNVSDHERKIGELQEQMKVKRKRHPVV